MSRRPVTRTPRYGPLTDRQALFLRQFINCYGEARAINHRPTIPQIARALGATSRAGVVTAYHYPLGALGYIAQDEPFAVRSYYITDKGRRALAEYDRQKGLSCSSSARTVSSPPRKSPWSSTTCEPAPSAPSASSRTSPSSGSPAASD